MKQILEKICIMRSSVTLKYDDFKNILMTVLNSHAPTKQRILRGNNQLFMNKTLSQAPSCIGLN